MAVPCMLYTRHVIFLYCICHLHITRVSGFGRGAAEISALLGYCVLSPSVCCPTVQGRILHWTQKSEYVNVHVDLCKYLPIRLTYALFVQTVIVLCANCSFIFKIFTQKLNSILCFQTFQQIVVIFKPYA
jgi:hypothetical protein